MKLHKPPHFADRPFAETPLAEEPDQKIRHALAALLDGHAFFLTGAGASAGAPTLLPTGPQLAAGLVAWARSAGFDEAIDSVGDESDLGQVCAAVEADAGRLALLYRLVRAAEWEDADLNLVHFSIAMLFAEELLRISFTANWDVKLQEAERMIGSDRKLRFPYDKTTMGLAGSDPLFVHIHGCLSAPDSLVATTDELDKPEAMRWSDPNLRAALSTQDPILVGFAAEPDYVVRSLGEMRDVMERPPASVIGLETLHDFRANSPDLTAALRLDENPDRYVQGDACDVLGEVLRGCYRKLVTDVLDEAAQRAGACGGAAQLLSSTGVDAVRTLIHAYPLEALVSVLWHAAARPSDTGTARQPPMQRRKTEIAECLASVMVLASCSDIDDLELVRGGFRLARDTSEAVDLWPLVPETVLSPSDAQKRAYRHSDRFTGPGDAGLPLILLCGGTAGAVPSSSRVSLMGTSNPASVGSGLRTPSDLLTLSELDSRIQLLGSGSRRLDEVLQL